jgi:hypothetical protein
MDCESNDLIVCLCYLFYRLFVYDDILINLLVDYSYNNLGFSVNCNLIFFIISNFLS